MKNKSLLYIALTLCLLGLLFSIIGYNRGGLDNIVTEEKENTVTKKLDSFNKLDIDINYNDVLIQQTDSDKASITYPNNRKAPIHTSVTDDTLVVKDQPSGKINLFFNYTSGLLDIQRFLSGKNPFDDDKIIISIPKDTKVENLKSNLKTSDLEIDHLSFKNVEVFSAVGEIEIDKTIIDSGNLSTNTGELHIEDSEISNTKMNVNTGDTVIHQSILSSTSLSTNTGDFKGENITYRKDNQLVQSTGDTNISLANYHLSIYPNKEAKTPLQLKTSDTDSLTIKNDIGDIVVK